ncbi:MAG TPA: family 16 glycoside hydrolase [Longimicrobiales bacterium]
MPTAATPQVTDFTRDVLGRYVCNGLDEALRSTTERPDARPFDVIVLGGGTFGLALAHDLFVRDVAHRHRILVLEAGPMLLPDHVQNLPLLGLGVPGATSIANQRAAGQDGAPRDEVWGLPWHSNVEFPGLAYCVGGRSLFWGGWAPEPLPAELPQDRWPPEVVRELFAQEGLLRRAAGETGVSAANDFLAGPLHRVLRQRLFEALQAGQVSDALPLSEVPLSIEDTPTKERDLYKLDAPLAVQARPPREGTFLLNKFSTVPLAIRAVRAAHVESGGDDVKKRLMLVPRCHVTQLITAGDRVVEVRTNQGNVPVPPEGVVVLALGTIENTRIALASFEGLPGYERIGGNLMAHLRSNLTIRIPREALPDDLPDELDASVLFVRGRHVHEDGSEGHFHLQITAAGLGPEGPEVEPELFQTIPDVELLDHFRGAIDDEHVVINIRGIGEMSPHNPNSRIVLDSEVDEFGIRRAFVQFADPRHPDGSARDLALWNAMDRAADEVARAFAGDRDYEVLVGGRAVPVPAGRVPSEVLPFERRREGIGSSHDEAGTLWMGPDPETSVTDPDGCFHGLTNAYVVGPALFPTVGAATPMLTGLALVRRLARHLAPAPTPYTPSGGFRALFDGIDTSGWLMAGSGRFLVVNGAIETVPGDDLGLVWCRVPTPQDFVLRLEWKRFREEDTSGVFLRFPHPESRGYENAAYVAVDFGFEVRIDEVGAPDGSVSRRTGAINGEPKQERTLIAARPPGLWNEFEIRVEGQEYTVLLNGERVTRFRNNDPARGLPSTDETPTFIGFRVQPGSRMAFRNVRIRALEPAPVTERVLANVGEGAEEAEGELRGERWKSPRAKTRRKGE